MLWKLDRIHPFEGRNGRTARALAYLLLLRKLTIFPGAATIPERIAQNKGPYYDALEHADAAATATGRSIGVSALEEMLERILINQLTGKPVLRSGNDQAIRHTMADPVEKAQVR